MEKEQKRQGKTKWFLKKAAKVVCTGVVALHLAAQSAYWFNDAWNSACPSPQRKAFEQTFGFPIKGWKKDIENRDILTSVGEATHQRTVTRGKPLGLTSFRIESPYYLKKSLIQQAGEVAAPYGGVSNPILNPCTVNDNKREAAFHEINHAEMFLLVKKSPLFRKQWCAIAQNSDGTSPYHSPARHALSKIRGGDKIIEKMQKRPTQNVYDNYKQGFVSDYARTSFYEDVAELCAEANFDPHNFSLRFFQESTHYDKIMAKTKLAEQYGLVPCGISEYISLIPHYNASFEPSGHDAYVKDSETYVAATEEFLRTHPKTTLETKIRAYRAWIMDKLSQDRKSTRLNSSHSSISYAVFF